ncbi:STAS domain-containing protein [Treponema pedis]|nr:STAS domain-containing protein [Treponema pedis]QOW60884.1 STAS domain-containing protein [Treponema pedis]QSI04066.1 anti-sigma factor antagonist [Treponema pedis]
MDNLIINETKAENYTLLAIDGTINSYTYGDFETKVYSAIKEKDLVLDLSCVTNMSSSGLGVLMSAYNDGEEYGHELFILNPSDIVRMVIDSTGFSDMFKVIHSVNDM